MYIIHHVVYRILSNAREFRSLNTHITHKYIGACACARVFPAHANIKSKKGNSEILTQDLHFFLRFFFIFFFFFVLFRIPFTYTTPSMYIIKLLVFTLFRLCCVSMYANHVSGGTSL
jgi:hypothetical protein